MPKGGYAGTRKHFVSAGGDNLAQFLSYLTSHAYGTGAILKSEQINATKQVMEDFGAPIVASRPPPVESIGKTFTPAGVASTLTLKGVNIHSGDSYATKIPAAISTNKKSLSEKVIKGHLLEITDDDISKIIKLAKQIWVQAAEQQIDGNALYEYLRAMRVEWRNNALSLRLEGWEAASKEIGWAPKAGGLDAGLGKYDGSLHDLKPLVLGGKSSKTIPLKLEGSSADFESALVEQMAWPGTNPYHRERLSGLASEEVARAMKTKPGEAVRLEALKGRRGSRSHLRGLKSVESHLNDLRSLMQHKPSFKDDDLTETDRFKSALRDMAEKQSYGRNMLFGKKRTVNGETKFVNYSRSTLSGAVRAKSFRRPSQGRTSEGTFIVFRTMVSDNYIEKKRRVTSEDGSVSEKTGGRYSRARESRKQNNYKKWWTEGRAPYQLMESVLDRMRSYISDMIFNKRASSIKESFASSVKDFTSAKLSAHQDEEMAAELEELLTMGFNKALESIASGMCTPPKKRRR